MSHPCYSFVVPIFNEAESLPELARQLAGLMSRLDGDAEVLLVDDGSTDESAAIMRRICDDDDRVRVLRLSRNFGHQVAITAGLDHARGDAIVIMDADLQDPPEVVLEMARQWRAGFNVVYAVREERVGDGPIKRLTAKWFYRFLNRITDIEIPRDAGDFRLVDRSALDAVLRMREHRPFVRGMFSWVGFDQTGVRFVRPARFAGSTKYSLRRMMKFAADGVLSFSVVPLRIVLGLGFAISMLSLVLGFVAIGCEIAGVYTTPEWASISLAVAFVGGIQLTVLGILGSYISRIYDEVRQRPLYLLRDEPAARP